MKLMYLLIPLCTLVSCDPSVDYDQIIQNDSDYDLWLKIKSLYLYDSLLLPKREETIVFGDHGLGTPLTYVNCDSFYSDTTELLVKDSTHLKVTLDIGDLELWTYSLLEKYSFGGGRCECRLIITNDDIQK